MKAKEKLLKRMSDQTGQQITEINLISWDMVEPLINELEVKVQQIIELIEGEIQQENEKGSELFQKLDEQASFLVKKAFSNSMYHIAQLNSLLTKIGEIK